LRIAAASGFGFRFPPEIREIARFSRQNNAGLRNECFSRRPEQRLVRIVSSQATSPVICVGRFHAAALYPD